MEGQRGVCKLALLGFLLCEFLLVEMYTRFRTRGGLGCSVSSLLFALVSSRFFS